MRDESTKVQRLSTKTLNAHYMFYSYFASQCTPVIEKSQLPSLEFETSKRLEKYLFLMTIST